MAIVIERAMEGRRKQEGRERRKDTKREIFHLELHSLNAPYSTATFGFGRSQLPEMSSWFPTWLAGIQALLSKEELTID